MNRTILLFVALAFIGRLSSPTYAEDREVIFDFSKLKSLEEFDAAQGTYGVWRPEDPPELQYVDQSFERLSVADGKDMGFLCIKYLLVAPDTYNGWYFKPANEDWRRFKKGAIVLRIGIGPESTQRFKLELKYDTRAGSGTSYVYVVLKPADLRQISTNGYVDYVLPLRHFGDIDWSHVREFVICFERSRLSPPTAKQGEIRLATLILSELEKPPAVGTDK